jgi:hypothetical protein
VAHPTPYFLAGAFVDENFRFNITQWRAVVEDFTSPPGADITVILDPAFTSNNTSDKSALVASFKVERDDGVRELNILDTESERWKGGALADSAIDFCVKWNPAALKIERIPGVDILIDLILDKCRARSITAPHIEAFTPNCQKSAKNHRILKLQTLWCSSPPAIRIRYGHYIGPLFEEVEAFVPSRQNRGRQINTLDALALACGFR